MRSSATAEDLPDASFAGQQETFLNVRGEAALLDACRRCYASLFTDRAISYRETKGFDHLQVALSIGVQRMVRADLGGSGVMFSIDTETRLPRRGGDQRRLGSRRDRRSGHGRSRRYLVSSRCSAIRGCAPIIEKTLGGKERKLVYAERRQRPHALVDTTRREREAFVLQDDEILQLARWAVADRDSTTAARWTWNGRKDGETGELFIVQARPETVHRSGTARCSETYRLQAKGKRLLPARRVGEAIASGPVCLIRDAARYRRLPRRRRSSSPRPPIPTGCR